MGSKRTDSGGSDEVGRDTHTAAAGDRTAKGASKPVPRRTPVTASKARVPSKVEGRAPKQKESVARREQVKSVTRASMLPRHQLIAEAAYFLAEQRGFAPGSELDDWLRAESAVDEWLARRDP